MLVCATVRVSILHIYLLVSLLFSTIYQQWLFFRALRFLFSHLFVGFSHALPLSAAAKRNIYLYFMLSLGDYLLRKYLLYR